MLHFDAKGTRRTNKNIEQFSIALRSLRFEQYYKYRKCAVKVFPY